MEIGGVVHARSCVLASFFPQQEIEKTCGSTVEANFCRLPVQLINYRSPELVFGQG